MARATSLAEFAIKNPQLLTPERRTLASEIIERAIQIWNTGSYDNLGQRQRDCWSLAFQSSALRWWI